MATQIKKINKSLMNIVEKAGTKDLPINMAKERTRAAGKMISAANAQLRFNDQSGVIVKPDLLQ